ncbi:MAG: DUF2029 domain-containing protein [Bacteroidetes bacterium]|nr:DUF2029 domain-containing protein [Bacteroidota bacterium]
MLKQLLSEENYAGNKFLRYLFTIKFWIILHLILTLFYWIQVGIITDNYNNFLIFRGSFFHLIDHKGLYAPYPNEYVDLYLYSPVFAFLMAAFAWIPVKVGLLTWLYLSVVVLLSALQKLSLKKEHLLFILILLIFDLGNNLQLAQANIIVLGGMIWCFYFLEEGHNLKFAILCSLLFWVKVYPAIMILMVFIYDKSLRTIAWFLLFLFLWGLLPLTLIGPHELVSVLSDWFYILSGSSILEQYSIMGFFRTQLKLNFPELYFVLGGMIFFAVCLYLLMIKKGNLNYEQRISIFSFVLIWVVVFNRAAESASYLLVSTGIYIWTGFHRQRNSVLVIFLLYFLLTTLLPSDIFYFINHLFKSGVLKPIAGCVFLILILSGYIRSMTTEKLKLNEY